ncbi:MAG TPA: M43 family zinc metalloprotease, partial [Chitinophagaceae bacterium]|nr:M43 family zinc metalloprotease [Chitinophagaceae bacterium]
MKKFMLSLLGITILGTSLSQAQRICGSADHYQTMLHEDAQFAQNRLLIEKQTEEATKNPTKTRVVITIPVVFHIVYNTATQNVSDAQIASQLAVLNADYRKLNADWSNTPAAFQSLVADCEIQFCMAQQDPSGNATNGIVRKSTSVASFSTNDAVKKSAQGGDDAWNSSKYLNIWVCNLSGGVLGYAQFPGGAAATDGVVITYTGFGTTGTAAAPFNKGRTATHEVGHWLNLFHIWGDDGTACTGSDLVGDTPNQGGENYGCPTFPHVSCSNGTNGDMFMNYMDYTDDACMYMFTAGQKARMTALFATGGSRVSLLTSNGCQPPVAAACGAVTGLTATGITTTGATLGWTAVSGATSYDVQYKLSTATTWTSTTSTTTTLVLSGLTAGSTYNYQVRSVCAAGTGNYSASTFTTTSTTGTCSNNYESNNTRNTAATIAINTNINSMIGTSTDKDYFKIVTTSAAPKLKVTLSNLPKDYDLKLYNSSGSLLATSANGSTTTET